MPNNTTVTILSILQYANTKSASGILYSTNTALRADANVLLTNINESGDI